MDTVRPGGRVLVRTWSAGEEGEETVLFSISDDPDQPSAGEGDQGVGLLLRQLDTPDSQRALAFVQTIIRDLGVRMTVQRSSGGGTITLLTFSLRESVAGAP
jgi:hypothetical protein